MWGAVAIYGPINFRDQWRNFTHRPAGSRNPVLNRAYRLQPLLIDESLLISHQDNEYHKGIFYFFVFPLFDINMLANTPRHPICSSPWYRYGGSWY